jgi:hypothetical protein
MRLHTLTKAEEETLIRRVERGDEMTPRNQEEKTTFLQMKMELLCGVDIGFMMFLPLLILWTGRVF